jgi:hemerythrin-like domain-containing protein
MSFTHQVPRALDDEHRASLALLEKVERAARAGDAAALQGLAPAFARHLEHEIGRHFGFEENELFTRLAEAGDGGMAALLTEEHESIRAVAGELLPLLDAGAGWHALRPLALEFVERQVVHIQKETMALLPLLDELLDDDTDRDLAFAYAAS